MHHTQTHTRALTCPKTTENDVWFMTKYVYVVKINFSILMLARNMGFVSFRSFIASSKGKPKVSESNRNRNVYASMFYHCLRYFNRYSVNGSRPFISFRFIVIFVPLFSLVFACLNLISVVDCCSFWAFFFRPVLFKT